MTDEPERMPGDRVRYSSAMQEDGKYVGGLSTRYRGQPCVISEDQTEVHGDRYRITHRLTGNSFVVESSKLHTDYDE